ncbi:hypothetical protein C8R44DRAFT_989056 [Mycena epipterygia]|nr:hypothetical protein C8R44DRAFT_989056 [Mycena epipterygia]
MSKFAASEPRLGDHGRRSLVHALQFPLSSFIDDADGEPDVDLDEFFNPPSKKGKGKAAGPPPTPPPASKKGLAATPASPAVAGPSSTLHPRLRLIQFTPTKKYATRFTAKEHQLVQRNVEAVGHGQTILDDCISKVQHDLTAGLEGIDARLVGMAADLAEAANSGNPLTTSALIPASNKHTANSTAMGTAINDAYLRIPRHHLPSGAAPAQRLIRDRMSGDDAALINAAPIPNGKRAHDEDDDSVKRHPPGLVRPSPSWPRLRFSGVRSCRRRVTHHLRPAHPSARHRLYRYCPGLRRTGLRRTHCTWRTPSSSPERPSPLRSDGLGRELNHFPRNLISNVLTKTMHGVCYTSRRGSDDATAILIFDADTVAATWFIHTWNNAARPGDVAAPSLRTFLFPASPKWIESDPLPRPALFTFV